MNDKMDAVVLAGGGGIEEGAPVKALVPIGSRLMVDYVIEALRNSKKIERIVLVGPDDLRSIYGQDTGFLFADQGSTLLGSFVAGVDVIESPNPWVLACTGDIPFLTTEAVDDFISKCCEVEADFYYPILRKETIEKRFPDVKRTYASLRDGTFTGGNFLLIRQEIISRCLPIAEEFVRLRKSPLALAKLVGVGMLWKHLFGQLTVAEAERRVSELVGARGSAVVSSYPEIGVDVDKSSDLELAQELSRE
ncbi:MAG TPA: NTP transferase domain-containing protein [Syntrophomonadaceae bacterium]|nr:NTP transferase domain-containing protein [Syntrophomonadaceae bacterium]